MLPGYPRSHRRHNIAVFRPAVCSIRGNHCNTFVVVLGSWKCVEVCLYPGIVVGRFGCPSKLTRQCETVFCSYTIAAPYLIGDVGACRSALSGFPPAFPQTYRGSFVEASYALRRSCKYPFQLPLPLPGMDDGNPFRRFTKLAQPR
jgi:hypothetical protein